MKIVTVEYRRLRSFGTYENETVGAVAEVESGEDPSTALMTLQSWVQQQLGDVENASNLRTEVWRAENRLRELNSLLSNAGERWEKAKKILAAHGIDVPVDHGSDDGDDLKDLPF